MSMKKKISTLFAACALIISLTACSPQTQSEAGKTTSPEQTTPATSSAEIDTEFTSKDMDIGYDEADAVKISLDGTAATVSGSGASFENGVVTIAAAGTYIISGTLSNGRILVNASDSDKIRIVLDNASISCSTYAPIFIQSADKVFVTLVGENTLTDGATYSLGEDDSNVDAALFSRADLTLNGNGTLTVNGSCNHAICSKDDLVVCGGTYNLTAVGGGIYGKDCVKIAAGTFNMNVGSDGIQSDNAEDEGRGFVYIKDGTFNITAATDGIQAETVLLIDGGSYTLTTGGGSQNASQQNGEQNGDWGNWGGRGGGGMKPNGPMPEGQGDMPILQSTTGTEGSSAITTATTETDTQSTSAKGLKSASELIVNGGTFTLDTSDDSLHSDNSITVANGTFTIASGDDGMHADTTLKITGGNITITKSYEGIESSDITVSGGTINLTASDDGFNAAGGNDGSSISGRPGQGGFSASSGTMTLSGGSVTINADGDGLDSNGSITMTGGTYTVFGPTSSGNGALDYDSSFTCDGGTLIALGSTGMAQGLSGGSAASLFAKISGTANSVLKVTDASGNTLCEITSPKSYGCALITTPEMTAGTTYTFLLNGTQAGSQAAA